MSMRKDLIEVEVVTRCLHGITYIIYHGYVWPPLSFHLISTHIADWTNIFYLGENNLVYKQDKIR